jgi:hypothetical protein
MNTLQSHFSAQQLELLNMFSRPVDPSDWENIKQIITNYFAKKSIEEANRIWDEEKWDNKKIEEILNSTTRTKYNK